MKKRHLWYIALVFCPLGILYDCCAIWSALSEGKTTLAFLVAFFCAILICAFYKGAYSMWRLARGTWE